MEVILIKFLNIYKKIILLHKNAILIIQLKEKNRNDLQKDEEIPKTIEI